MEISSIKKMGVHLVLVLLPAASSLISRFAWTGCVDSTIDMSNKHSHGLDLSKDL